MDTGKITAFEPGKSIAAEGRIDPEEAFFQDHFPEFPTLPGVLMIEILKKIAEKYFEKENIQRFSFKEIRNVRFANFLKPGAVWQGTLDFISSHEDVLEFKGRLFSEARPVCSALLKFQVGVSQE